MIIIKKPTTSEEDINITIAGEVINIYLNARFFVAGALVNEFPTEHYITFEERINYEFFPSLCIVVSRQPVRYRVIETLFSSIPEEWKKRIAIFKDRDEFTTTVDDITGHPSTITDLSNIQSIVNSKDVSRSSYKVAFEIYNLGYDKFIDVLIGNIRTTEFMITTLSMIVYDVDDQLVGEGFVPNFSIRSFKKYAGLFTTNVMDMNGCRNRTKSLLVERILNNSNDSRDSHILSNVMKKCRFLKLQDTTKIPENQNILVESEVNDSYSTLLADDFEKNAESYWDKGIESVDIRNDLCHNCKMLLYDNVYMHFDNNKIVSRSMSMSMSNYFCLRCILLRNEHNTDASYDILVIPFSRTFREVCNILITDTKLRDIYVALYELDHDIVSVKEYSNSGKFDVIEFGDYVGIRNSITYKSAFLFEKGKKYFMYNDSVSKS